MKNRRGYPRRPGRACRRCLFPFLERVGRTDSPQSLSVGGECLPCPENAGNWVNRGAYCLWEVAAKTRDSG